MTELKAIFKAVVESPNFNANTTYCSLEGGGKYVYHSAIN